MRRFGASSCTPFEDQGSSRSRTYNDRLGSIAFRAAPQGIDASSTRSALPLPNGPSLAVLPFTNMSADPEQEYFADGMVEEIITALSRVRWFFVIAWNSSFTYKGRSVDIRQVGRELGVRYVLEGSIRKAGNRVRITGQLVEAANGRHVWADRFEGSVEDIFDLQDRITESVVGAIEPSSGERRSTGPPRSRPMILMPTISIYRPWPIIMHSASPRATRLCGYLIAHWSFMGITPRPRLWQPSSLTFELHNTGQTKRRSREASIWPKRRGLIIVTIRQH